MYKLVETDLYLKKLKKFLKKHKDIYKKYQKTILLLSQNPQHPSLRLHKLKGDMQEYHSVSIDIQYRIICDFIIIDDEIILVDIGTHDEVY